MEIILVLVVILITNISLLIKHECSNVIVTVYTFLSHEMMQTIARKHKFYPSVAFDKNILKNPQNHPQKSLRYLKIKVNPKNWKILKVA